jgi:fumarate reductase subunit C
MSQSPVYTDYHPRWLRRHVSTLWWLEKRAYFAFILRESTCMFVAWFVAYLLFLVRAVSGGFADYQVFLSWSAQPGVLMLNIVTVAFLVFHAITFFIATPQALVVHLGGRRVANNVVAAAHYAAWAGVSLLMFWVLVILGN